MESLGMSSWAGSQVSRFDETDPRYVVSGTIGAFAKSTTDKSIGILTNQHVALKPGVKLYFPWPSPLGKHLPTTESTITLVDDEKWYGPLVNEPNAKVRADCAFAKIDPKFDKSNLNAEIMDVGQLGQVMPISLDDMSIIGQKVLRVGRTTGLRRGTITAFGYMYGLDSEDPNAAYTSYTDLLIAGDGGVPFSTHGDSGSLIVMDNKMLNPIGLLWGSWEEKLQNGQAQEKWSWGISLDRIEKALVIEVITDTQAIHGG
jgi:hypothetical protein